MAKCALSVANATFYMEYTMNTEVKNQQQVESNRNNTLKALFGRICEDNEFTLLRQTLELYCEEIARKGE